MSETQVDSLMGSIQFVGMLKGVYDQVREARDVARVELQRADRLVDSTMREVVEAPTGETASRLRDSVKLLEAAREKYDLAYAAEFNTRVELVQAKRVLDTKVADFGVAIESGGSVRV